MATYYKVINRNGISFYAGWKWPLPKKNGSPGDWTPKIDPGMLSLCSQGYHVADAKTLKYWLREGSYAFITEVRGRGIGSFRSDTKKAFPEARLVKRLGLITYEVRGAHRHGGVMTDKKIAAIFRASERKRTKKKTAPPKKPTPKRKKK